MSVTDTSSNQPKNSEPGLVSRIGRAWLPVLIPLAVMWAVQIINAIFGYNLNALGISPRSLEGLVGIIFSPLLHVSFAHLVSNTITWLVLATVAAFVTEHFGRVTAGIWILAGVFTWLIGRADTVHLGASGVIYGYAAFIIVFGFLVRRFLPMVVSILVILAYAGLFWGLLPLATAVSWESHLSGAIAGVIVAFAATRRQRKARQALKEADEEL